MRFSIKDLLIATTLVAVGMAMRIVAVNDWWRDLEYLPDYAVSVRLLLYLLGFCCVGLGVVYPCKSRALRAVAVLVALVLGALSLCIIVS
jgi:hypothetical protein